MNYFVLPGLPKKLRECLSPQETLALVELVTGVSMKPKAGKSNRETTQAKQLAAYLLSTKNKMTVVEITKLMYLNGTNSRRSVYNLLEQHANIEQTEPEYRSLVKHITQEYDRRLYNATHKP